MGFEGPAFAESPGLEGKTPDKKTARDARMEAVMHRESFELNGAQVEFLGVNHDPMTAERFAPELEEAVRRASIVLLESAPNAMGTFSDKTIQEYRELMGNKLKLTNEEIIKSFEAGKRGLAFYSKMEVLAAKHGKPLAVADPIDTDDGGFLQLFTENPFRSADETAEQAKTAMILGGALIAALPTISNTIRERFSQREAPGHATIAASTPEAEHPTSESEQQPSSSGSSMNRRQFLRVLGGGIAAAGMASEVASAIAKKSDPAKGSYGRRGDNPFGAALYDGLDYRDVITAQGLDRLTKGNIHAKSIVVIYGDGHRASIRHYAESPKERALKRTAYAPYQKIAPPKLRIFKHRGGRDWQRVHEEEL